VESPEESDQLPEEGPEEQVVEDEPGKGSSSREAGEEATHEAGGHARNDDDEATGNPHNAA